MNTKDTTHTMAEFYHEMMPMLEDMEHAMYVAYLADELDNFIKDAYLAHRDRDEVDDKYTDHRFFSNTIEWFKNYVKKDPRGITFTEVLNCGSSQRFFGTFANVITTMVFYPFAYVLWDEFMRSEITNRGTYSMRDQYVGHLSKHALHDILSTTFRLIAEDGLVTTSVDFHKLTPAQHICFYHKDSLNLLMPPEIKAFLPSFKRVFMRGSEVVNVLQRAVRAWSLKRREKRAVEVIESWWFEVINCPYTKCGEHMMQQRAVKWAQEYC
jgi:hypothetical protein